MRQDVRNGGPAEKDIFGFDISTTEEFEIYIESGNQLIPRISSDTVVWADYGNEHNIYGATIPEPTTLFLLGFGAVILRRK